MERSWATENFFAKLFVLADAFGHFEPKYTLHCCNYTALLSKKHPIEISGRYVPSRGCSNYKGEVITGPYFFIILIFLPRLS